MGLIDRIRGGMGGMLDGAKGASADLALKGLRHPLNALVRDYAVITDLAYVDGKVKVSGSLLGNEDVVYEVSVGTVRISKDGRTVRLGDFSSNVQGIGNLLNAFATGPIAVPESAGGAMRMLGSLLGTQTHAVQADMERDAYRERLAFEEIEPYDDLELGPLLGLYMIRFHEGYWIGFQGDLKSTVINCLRTGKPFKPTSYPKGVLI